MFFVGLSSSSSSSSGSGSSGVVVVVVVVVVGVVVGAYSDGSRPSGRGCGCGDYRPTDILNYPEELGLAYLTCTSHGLSEFWKSAPHICAVCTAFAHRFAASTL